MAVRLPRGLREIDTADLARRAGLACVGDDEPGLHRRRCGRGFRYLRPDGSAVDALTADRLRALAVPPAWNDVWFAPVPDAHLVATGRDAEERKQYRYHDRFRAESDRIKFDRLAFFGRGLVDLRKAVATDLDDGVIGERRVAVAAAVALIDRGSVRVGNRRSARTGHHGATTLTGREVDEVDPASGRIVLDYVGKGGAARQVSIVDPDLALVLRDLLDHDATHLFSYDGDDGTGRAVCAEQVNAYVATHAGRGFSAKDLRTWGGTVAAVEAIADGAPDLEAVDVAAERLGNTRAVARSAYVHPALLADPDRVRTAYARSRTGRWLDRAESATAKALADLERNG